MASHGTGESTAYPSERNALGRTYPSTGVYLLGVGRQMGIDDDDTVVATTLVVMAMAIGAAASASAVDTAWYRGLEAKLSLPHGDHTRVYIPCTGTLPRWLFPCAWTMWYTVLAMGLADALRGGRRFVCCTILLCLLLDCVWCVLFFQQRRLCAAVVIAGLLFGAAATLTVCPFDGLLRLGLIGHAMWCLYAFGLTVRACAEYA